jgi:hypothetical protein
MHVLECMRIRCVVDGSWEVGIQIAGRIWRSNNTCLWHGTLKLSSILARAEQMKKDIASHCLLIMKQNIATQDHRTQKLRLSDSRTYNLVEYFVNNLPFRLNYYFLKRWKVHSWFHHFIFPKIEQSHRYIVQSIYTNTDAQLHSPLIPWSYESSP